MERGSFPSIDPAIGAHKKRKLSARRTHLGIRKYGDISTTLLVSVASAARIAAIPAPIERPAIDTLLHFVRSAACASRAQLIHSAAVDAKKSSGVVPCPG